MENIARGNIKQMIDTIILKRSKGNPLLVGVTRTKLLLKGINVNKFTETSSDDPVIIHKLLLIAKELGVAI
ncbi:MAG: hypothetical protein LC115_11990 [Bacteroidia bacterium]|nr:hypothetical protein [Bacteroidia bacterium]